jgi:crotonobetainyl-CoA:carnitine CoA-transferase CaiB-like acyl-CoA transferase
MLKSSSGSCRSGSTRLHQMTQCYNCWKNIACRSPVLTVAEAIAHPHLRDRGTVTTIEDQFIGQFDVPGFPLRFSAFPDEPQLPAPTLGQHNTELLRDYLGYSAERIALLEAEGILHRGNR